MAELREEAEKQRDITLQIVLAVGTGLGLVLAWNQVESLPLNILLNKGPNADPEALWRWKMGLGLGVAFIGAYFLSLAYFVLRGFWRHRRGRRRDLATQLHRHEEGKDVRSCPSEEAL